MTNKELNLINEQWKDKEFNNHCSRCKFLKAWKPEESRTVYVEYVQYCNNIVYGMTLKDFNSAIKRYN